MTYCKTVRAELPFVIGFTDPMDMWKLYRKYCAALFFKDKDPGSRWTRPMRHFDLSFAPVTEQGLIDSVLLLSHWD